MKAQDYTATITVDAPAHEVFRNINRVTKWWSPDFEGASEKLNDAFTVHFGDIHVSTQKLIDFIPDKKVEWLVTDSDLNFIKDRHEWTNTRIRFDISEKDGQTQVLFTHFGLVPEVECYKSCVGGWDYFIKGSLYKWLTVGVGTPGL